MAEPARPRVFLDVSIANEHAGRLTIELFTDQTPRTCENFRQLCSGEHDGMSYAAVPFHRVIDEFMIQGGDIANGDGTGTLSIYGAEFDDENVSWRDLDAAGLVCCANRGKDTNGSQFFITLEACPHLNGKHTVFGRLVSSSETLQKIATVAVDKNDRPLHPVLISRCGELQKVQKTQTSDVPKATINRPSFSRDRGRRRKSDHSDDETTAETPEGDDVAHKQQPSQRRIRRQSDAVVDEGIRGRPRMRSGSRSRSRHSSSGVEDDNDAIIDALSSDSDRRRQSIHKRKRSPSPSRHVGVDHLRRRRSLPNQYDNIHRHDRSHYRPEYEAKSDSRRYRHGQRDARDRDHHRYQAPGARRSKYGDDERHRATRHHYESDGRLHGSGLLGGHADPLAEQDARDPRVKFKGRGIMKYKEPDRAW